MGHSIFYATLPPPPMDGGFDRRGSDFSEIGLFGHVFKKKSNCQGISLLKGYVPTENWGFGFQPNLGGVNNRIHRI